MTASVKVKVLTLTQPWASLVMLGEKRVETRSVLFGHRGPLYIHAGKFWNAEAMENETFQRVLARHGIAGGEQLPVGKVLGSVNVVDGCRFTGDTFPLCLPPAWRGQIAEHEHNFGGYAENRCGLLLMQPIVFAQPLQARGMNGLWTWDCSAEIAEARP